MNTQLTGDAQWWRGAVIYQIYPRSYQDSTGDGVGDLKGITSRLDHIKSLGVDAIWLSPFFTSPMKDFGYDVSDYCDVDPVFGTLADFDAMVARAHDLGLRVMIDQVLSHSSDQHPWFAESRANKTNAKSDWYVWADARPDGTPPNNWQSVFGGSAWTWDARRCQYYLHNFLSSQPDLNFHNSDVQDALLDTVRFWLDRGVDGFRLDTVNFYVHNAALTDNPPADNRAAGIDAPEVNPYGFQRHIHDKTQPENIPFLKRFRALLDEYPGTTAVGEVGDGDRSLQTMAEYTAGDDLLHMCYSFDMLGPNFSPEHFRGCVEQFEAASDKFADGASWACWAFSNHDVMRHMTRWAEHCDDPMQLAAFSVQLLTSLKGSVCIYQGEELALPEADVPFEDLVDPYGITFWPEFKGRDGCRTPMIWESNGENGGFSAAKPWLPVTEPHMHLAVNAQHGVQGSALEAYRAHLAFRATRPSLIKGDIEFVGAPDGVLAFVRRTEGEATFCAFNLTDAPIEVALPKGATPLRGADFSDDTLTLKGTTAAFASM